MARNTAFEIAIVGGGIHGSVLLLDLLRVAKVPASAIVVVDPHPQPLAEWHHRTRNCTMTHLRSGASHSIDSRLNSLKRWARTHGYERFKSPRFRPAVELFATHAHTLLNRHAADVRRVRDEVQSIEQRDPFVLRGATHSIMANCVILALGSGPLQWPRWGRAADGGGRVHPRLVHVFERAFDPAHIEPGSRVVIVGGGISAGHLALNLSAPPWNAQVTLWTRRTAPVAQYDSDPCWIGPRCGPLFRHTSDYGRRRELLQRERHRGSIPPDMARDLEHAAQTGRIRRQMGSVASVGALNESSEAEIVVRGDNGEQVRADWVVCATGFGPQPPAEPLLAAIAAGYHAPRADCGYPIPTPNLEWIPGIYLSGALAELEIGPPARNIIGAHLASRRITNAIRASLHMAV